MASAGGTIHSFIFWGIGKAKDPLQTRIPPIRRILSEHGIVLRLFPFDISKLTHIKVSLFYTIVEKGLMVPQYLGQNLGHPR